LEAPKIEDSILAVDVKNITPEEKLNIGKPLEFDKSESYSFAEWLKITSFKPIVRDEVENEFEAENKVSEIETTTPLENKLAMIDKFISENPKIKPVSNTAPKPKLVNNDDAISDSLMTETLARIYLEQKNYDKAIQSYKILSLKYPEKSSFFADQIKLVEELKDNNT
jgi:ribosomal protein S18